MSAKRYLGTFYRGRRLYLPVLLLLLAATLIGTYYLARTQYEATARIWVDKPTLDSVLNPNSPSGYGTTPGQEQADKLNQLIQTDSFVAAVLTNTSAAGRLKNDSDREQVLKDVRGKLEVTSLGPNTVKISYKDTDPLFCQQMVQNTIDQFRSWDLTSRIEQSAVERQFFQKQLQIYQDQVNAAAKSVDDFQQAHPFPDPTSPQYLQLQSLQRNLESARALLNTTSAKIQEADAADSLSNSSRQYEFQILDPPTVPRDPAATLTRLAAYFALGLVVSFGIVFCAVAFATWQDTTIHNVDDLQRLTRVPLLDAVPHLSEERVRGGEHHHPAGASSTADVSGGSGQFEEPATVVPSSTVSG